MSNELVTMTDINTKIKEQVKVSFFNLLPDEQFQLLVDKEIEAFFETTSESCEILQNETSYNGRNFTLKTKVSPFRAIIWTECRKLVDEQIGQWFNKEGYNTISTYFNGIQNDEMTPKLNDYMSKHVETAAKGFFNQMFSNMFMSFRSDVVNDVTNQIQRTF